MSNISRQKINITLIKKYLIITAVSIFALAGLATSLVGVFYDRTYDNVKDTIMAFAEFEDNSSWQIEGYKQILDILLERFVH